MVDDEDHEAARLLASEMQFFEAAKFLRAEIGYGLREAAYDAERIASEHPTSEIARSLARVKEQRAQFVQRF